MCLRRKNVTQYMIPMPTRTVQITHNIITQLICQSGHIL